VLSLLPCSLEQRLRCRYTGVQVAQVARVAQVSQVHRWHRFTARRVLIVLAIRDKVLTRAFKVHYMYMYLLWSEQITHWLAHRPSSY